MLVNSGASERAFSMHCSAALPRMSRALLSMFLLATGIMTNRAEAANTPPSISTFHGYTMPQGLATGAIPFTIGDAETPADSLTLRLVSSNRTLIPEVDACGMTNGGFCFSGSGSNRTVTLRPEGINFGSAQITVIVADAEGATGSSSFWLEVTEREPHIIISAIADQVTEENTSTPAIPFRVELTGYLTGELKLQGISSDQALIPDTNIVIEGSISNRTMTITPAPNRFGRATITVVATDPPVKGAWHFLLTVDARLQIALADRRPVVAWTVTNAVLQQARETGGLWRDIVPVPASPYTIETGEANFYRLRSR